MRIFWFISIVFVVLSCMDNTIPKRKEISFFSAEMPAAWNLDTLDPLGLVDSHVGKIVTKDYDTIKYEYGHSVYKLLEPSKTVVPESQKKYWDSVGLSSEIILSSTPKEDIEKCLHFSQYYVKDTIDDKELIWIFPKKFSRGVTGAYFDDIEGLKLSIYMDSVGDNEKDFISFIKSIKFNK